MMKKALFSFFPELTGYERKHSNFPLYTIFALTFSQLLQIKLLLRLFEVLGFIANHLVGEERR